MGRKDLNVEDRLWKVHNREATGHDERKFNACVATSRRTCEGENSEVEKKENGGKQPDRRIGARNRDAGLIRENGSTASRRRDKRDAGHDARELRPACTQ